MIHRVNLRDLGELFRDEAQQVDRRYGEYLSQREAGRERRRTIRIEGEKTLHGLREVDATYRQAGSLSQA